MAEMGRKREKTRQPRSYLEMIVMVWGKDTERLNQGNRSGKEGFGDRCRGASGSKFGRIWQAVICKGKEEL